MKVLHVITRLIDGGAQHNTIASAVLQRRHGVDARIAHGPVGDRRHGDLAPLADDAGVPRIVVPTLVREPSPLADVRALVALVRHLRDGGYDVVHTHTSKAGIIGRLAARAAAARSCVHTPHGHVFHSYYGPLTTRFFLLLERTAATWAGRLVALTPRERDEHLALGIATREQFCIIPSGVDLARFRAARGQRSPSRARAGIDPAAPVIGCVARLSPVKGIDVLLQSVPTLRKRHPRLLVVVVGDGEERVTLARQAVDLGIADRTRFLGRRDHPERLLPAFDVLAVPSRNEGMGRVVVEAMAAGVPVVASRIGGLCDLVQDGVNGLLAPAGDPAALAWAIDRLLSNPKMSRRLAEAAVNGLSPELDQEAMVQRLLALYRKLAA